MVYCQGCGNLRADGQAYMAGALLGPCLFCIRLRGQASARRWKAKHPEANRRLKRESQRARKHRLRASGSWTPAQWLALEAEYGNSCVCCHTPENLLRTGLILVPDHIRPISKGG